MRIRSIKPEFWTSEDVADLTWDNRLIFIGLWSYVDDNGVGRDVPKLIVADLFPLEDDPRDTLAKVSRGLDELWKRGLVDRYVVDGKPFLFVTGWQTHQKIDRPSKGRYPLPTCGNAIPRDILATSSRVSRERLAPGTGEQGNRGTGETNTPSPADQDQAAIDVDDLLVTPDGATASDRKKTIDEHFAEFWETYPRKVGREDARRVWDRKRKAVSIQTILDGARRLAGDKNLPEDKKFIPHPSTWLSRGGWNDEPYPPKGPGGGNQRRDLANPVADEPPAHDPFAAALGGDE